LDPNLVEIDHEKPIPLSMNIINEPKYILDEPSGGFSQNPGAAPGLCIILFENRVQGPATPLSDGKIQLKGPRPCGSACGIVTDCRKYR
jgi:hypothetical protein